MRAYVFRLCVYLICAYVACACVRACVSIRARGVSDTYCHTWEARATKLNKQRRQQIKVALPRHATQTSHVYVYVFMMLSDFCERE